MERTIKKINK